MATVKQPHRPLVIIVSGPPASGKSSIARRIAADLTLPYVGKDDIKERLFDTVGVGDRDWSRQIGGATYELLYWFVGLLIDARQSLVVESNFRAHTSTSHFQALHARSPFDTYQVICRVDPETQRERYMERWRTGQRHPGHVDDVSIVDVSREPHSLYDPMPLDGSVTEIDTTDWNTIDYDGLLAALRHYRDVRD